MRTLVAAHSDFEVSRNWEGALATMVDAPFYEFFPYRLRISGADAITAMWERIFTPTGPIRCFDPTAHVPGRRQLSEYVGDEALVHISRSSFLNEGGVPCAVDMVVRYTFEGDRLQHETLWLDASLMTYFDVVFAADLRGLPGVTTF